MSLLFMDVATMNGVAVRIQNMLLNKQASIQQHLGRSDIDSLMEAAKGVGYAEALSELMSFLNAALDQQPKGAAQ